MKTIDTQRLDWLEAEQVDVNCWPDDEPVRWSLGHRPERFRSLREAIDAAMTPPECACAGFGGAADPGCPIHWRKFYEIAADLQERSGGDPFKMLEIMKQDANVKPTLTLDSAVQNPDSPGTP